MRKIFAPFALLSVVLALASCLGSDDSNVTYYDDTAITAFTLGTLKRTIHTLDDDGEDSTYTATISGSNYYFYIDQDKGEIYNPDSLPTGTNNEKVLCTVTSKNAGVVFIKNIDSDTLVYYSSTDSIDFSEPREFLVFSLSGLYYKTYTVSVNVHQEDSLEFNWSQKTTDTDAFGTMTAMRAVAKDSTIYVFGSDGSTTQAYSTSISDGDSWTALSLDSRISSDAEAYDNVILKDNLFYILCGDRQLLRSADGNTWEDVATAPIDKLVGAGGEDILYGYSASGDIMISEDGGATWASDLLSDDAVYLPTKNLHCSITDLATNDDAAQVLIVGNRDETTYPEDTTGVSWTKIEEYADDAITHSWMYQDLSDYTDYALPRMEGMTIVKYGKYLVALGGQGLGASTEEAYTTIYYSPDKALSWHKDDDMFYYPDDFDTSVTAVAAACDENNYLWVICGGTGQVWKGRLNIMGWSTEQTTFTE